MENLELTKEAPARSVKQEYYVRLKAKVEVAFWLDADSEDQARDIAMQWEPDKSGSHEVSEYIAYCSTFALVPLQVPIDLNWELVDSEVADLTVEAATDDDTE